MSDSIAGSSHHLKRLISFGKWHSDTILFRSRNLFNLGGLLVLLPVHCVLRAALHGLLGPLAEHGNQDPTMAIPTSVKAPRLNDSSSLKVHWLGVAGLPTFGKPPLAVVETCIAVLGNGQMGFLFLAFDF